MAKNDTNKTIVVNGFAYQDVEEAKKAQKEAEGVRYIKSKTDMDNPDMVLQIYKDIIRQDLFETEVGLAYLAELQAYLIRVPYIKDEDILPIPAPKREASVSILKRPKDTEYRRPHYSETPKPAASKNLDFKKRFRASFVVNIVLIICIAGMFLINMTTNQTTILNYESQVIDKYEHWEQELKEREAKVKEKEQEVGITSGTDIETTQQ